MAASISTSVAKVADSTSAPAEAESKPHHVLKNGRVVGFRNVHESFGNGVSPLSLLRTVVWPHLKGDLKSPDTSPPTVPVVKPTFLPDRTSSDSLRATWLGHACYYVEFPSGLRVLFDPVFEDRCSPFSFMGPKRYTEKPCDLADLPFVDAVFISHSHYDHLSHPSVLEIQRHHPDAQFFVGLGLADWFRQSGLRNVTELDWWEDADLEVRVGGGGAAKARTSDDGRASAASSSETTIKARVSCTPCQHGSARTLFDRDTTLWCSWAVRSAGKAVWFGGDTGYRSVKAVPEGEADEFADDAAHADLPTCPQFREIGALRGPFDLGLIPIGAYYPRRAFSPVHASPADAVEIFRDTRCARAMGIHWGTWALTMEEVLEPPMLLKRALRRRGIAETGVFDVCDIGESREF